MWVRKSRYSYSTPESVHQSRVPDPAVHGLAFPRQAELDFIQEAGWNVREDALEVAEESRRIWFLRFLSREAGDDQVVEAEEDEYEGDTQPPLKEEEEEEEDETQPPSKRRRHEGEYVSS